MTNKLHTIKDAQYCLWYFRKYVDSEAKLIGSFGKGKTESMKDIDIFLPNSSPHESLKKTIKSDIEADSVEITDWDGWFFHNSVFGNVDVFFDISEFDH